VFFETRWLHKSNHLLNTMNWSNVSRIQWAGFTADGRKHHVIYNGSRMLPAPYVGNGCIDLTPREFRAMFLILKAEEAKGSPCCSAGDVVTAAATRTIGGLDKVETYFKEQAANSKAAMDYNDKVKMKKQLKELEDRVRVLEDYIQGLCDVGRRTEPETLIHWQEHYEELEEDDAEANRDTATSEDGHDLST
jgi:hypothetical protein